MTRELAVHAALEIETLEGAPLAIIEYVVDEAMCFVTEIRVSFGVEGDGTPDGLLGKSLTLRITRAGHAAERSFHGVIFEARAAIEHDETLRFEVLARSVLGPLQLGRDSRIYQQKSVPDVVREVLTDAGVEAAAYDLDNLTATYEPHDYITQFNESDHDFVQRLIAEEGIGFYITHDFDAAKVVFFDRDTAFTQVAYGRAIPFQSDQALDAIATLREVRRAASDKVMLRDYDFEAPGTDLSERAEAESPRGREVYLHPGGFRTPGRGARLAQVALERLRVESHTYHGVGAVPHLEPGRTFELDRHPRVDLNVEMATVSATHWGRADGDARYPQLRTTFVAIPRSAAFRPSRAVDRPALGGTHVAFVTGAAGAELHGSAAGQVKVRFPWDRSGITDDQSSTWLRVGQLPLPGSMIVPRVGFEVLVDYEMADLDRPLVVGHLYNGGAMPPYELPGAAVRTAIQTATTGGGAGANELRFDDSAGGEEMFVNASFDYTCSIENDARTGVMANESSTVGANHTLSVTGSYNASVNGARTLSVTGNQNLGTDADYNSGTGADLSVTVGSRNEVCGGDLNENLSDTYTLGVGGLMAITGIAGITRNIVGSSETFVGAAWAEMSAASRMSTCGGSRKETVGALKFVKADTVATSCGAGYVQNCASESVKAGGNRVDSAAAISISAGGGLKVEAANVNVSGQTKVTLRIGGTTIDVLPASVKIKSSTIKLEGVKKLGSTAEHETA